MEKLEIERIRAMGYEEGMISAFKHMENLARLCKKAHRKLLAEVRNRKQVWQIQRDRAEYKKTGGVSAERLIKKFKESPHV